MRIMKNLPQIFIFSLIMSGVLVSLSTAQSELPARGTALGVGARAMGLGGAFSSVADDYTATYWNPAGLALIRRMEFFTSFQNMKFQNETSYSGYYQSNDESFTKMDAIGFAFPVPTYRGSLVFAFGYNRVHQYDEVLSFSWFNPTYNEANPDLNDEMTESWDNLEKGHLGQYTISGAVDISPNLSLGASLNFWRGKNDFESTYEAKDDSNFWTLDYLGIDEVINSELSATNFKLGAMYRMGEIMRFSGTIDLPYTLKIDEESSYHDKEIWESEEYVGEQEIYEDRSNYSFDYKIRTPFRFGAGASFYLPWLTLAGDLQFTDWSQMEYKTDPPFAKSTPVWIDGEAVYYDSTQTEINRDIRKRYRATTRINLGAEFTIPAIYTQLRSGISYVPSPFKDASSENNRKFFTLGAGILLDKQMKLDLAWVHGWWQEQGRFTEDIHTLKKDITMNHFEVSLAVRF